MAQLRQWFTTNQPGSRESNNPMQPNSHFAPTVLQRNRRQPKRSTRPPTWFRYIVLATATLIMCSCQTGLKQSQFGQNAVSQPAQDDAPHLIGSRWGTTPPRILAVNFNDSNVQQAAFAQPVQSLPQSAIGESLACRTSRCDAAGEPCAVCNPQSIVGPRDEYLCDGGDDNGPVGVRENWELEGLEQEDTVAHYDTIDGRTVVTPSNRVCIYAPKFGVVRRVVDLHQYARYDRATGFGQKLSLAKIDENEEAATSLAQLEPSIHRARQPSSLLRERQQAGELDRERRVAVSISSLAPYADLQIIRAGTISQEEKALVARSSLAAITWAGDQGPQVLFDSRQAQAAVSEKQVGVVFHLREPNKPRLRLVKLASIGSAKKGEEIEFTLRYDNIGNRVIGNVTIVDNLTTRLEYVPDSAKSTNGKQADVADFTTEPNGAGSQILRWEIRDPVEPGKGGVLQFKCRVR